jgi:hypothetical protein
VFVCEKPEKFQSLGLGWNELVCPIKFKNGFIAIVRVGPELEPEVVED